MKSLMRLWAFSLIATYAGILILPAAALAAAPPPPFPTCTLSINPSVIGPGDTTKITWNSTNATGGAITNVGNVGPSGNKQIIPPPGQIIIYVGSFTGPGGTANCSASVQISYGTGSASLTEQPVNPNPVQTSATGITIPDAGGTGNGGSGGVQQALVQCGTGAGIGNATSCQACNLAQLVSNIINFAIGLSIPIAAALFAWAGILYFTSGANPGNKERAKGIFSNAFIGFLIAITAWLVINTLLHVLLNQQQFPNSSWFTVQCSNTQRPVSGKISDVINSILPGVNTSQPSFTTDTLQTPPPGGACDADLGGCFDSSGMAVSSGPGGSCASGYVYTESSTEYWCQNPNNSSDWQETYGPDSYTVNPNLPPGNILAAANAYYGTDTSAGPGNGRVACAWAVNNVLMSDGIPPIDGDSVYNMETALQSGRGTYVSTPDAQPGDLIIWKDTSVNVSHVGICQDAGCVTALSNSSSAHSFTNISGSTFLGVPGRVYRVNR